MIITIAKQFTSDPSDHERSPTIIWKPCLTIVNDHMETRLYGDQALTLANMKNTKGYFHEL